MRPPVSRAYAGCAQKIAAGRQVEQAKISKIVRQSRLNRNELRLTLENNALQDFHRSSHHRVSVNI
jgi:hypothetical protein